MTIDQHHFYFKGDLSGKKWLEFTTISLSDLLTPWQTIEKRLHSAGQGDFVVSFYNPVSKKRDWQLNTARDTQLALGIQWATKQHSIPLLLKQKPLIERLFIYITKTLCL